MREGALRRWLGDAWSFDPVGAGVRVVAIVASIALGMASARPLIGILAAAGAYTVGFGASLDLRGSKPLLLVAASIGIGAFALAGSLAGSHIASAVVFATALGLAYGRVSFFGPSPAWIALRCGLAGLVATGFPAPLRAAALRALPIVVGGLAQASVLSLASSPRRPSAPAPTTGPFALDYGIELAIGLGAAVGVEHVLGVRNGYGYGYWVPMTTLLVLRVDGQQTMVRAVARVGGTIGGAGLASVVLLLLHPPLPVLVFLVALAAFGSYAFQTATYGVFAACATMYIVFILSLAGLPEGAVAVTRIVATAIGGAIALSVQGAGWLLRRSMA